MSGSIKSYTDLIAWQKAYAMGKSVYAIAATLPEGERFGLMASLRRLSYSISSHIAQGYGRGSTSEYIWSLKQARGEVYMLDTQLRFALDFKYLDDATYQRVKEQLDETERVLAGLIRSLGG
jgi:four helix bundle protein